ncbi:hypothetical protein C9439_05375 [archaeon SCG-AAA382B04]|nr:hypothetical protein C9439_05375 [archaeon SCG-AAA382B04]
MADIFEWAEERPLFTLNDLERRFNHDRKYLRLKLHRMVERDKLIRVERGKYTVHDDPMIYATYIETPSFFSYWTALRYYNLTTQQPTRLHVVTRKNRKDIESIIFHSSKNIFGYGKKRYQNFQVFIAEEEKLLLDCLNGKTVPVEELKGLVKKVDKKKIVEYCSKFDSRALCKRAGFLLERAGKDVDKLQNQVNHNYTPLDLSKPREGEKNSRWKILVNSDVD